MSRLPKWLDSFEYPFHLQKYTSSAGTLNYVDEGQGPLIVFLHGNPTWSFLYRKVIKHLSNNFRCVVPDYPGFGLSDTPENFSYTPEAHHNIIAELLQSFDADNITLVLHDWGGPIGLKYAIENPSRIHKIVLFNTWMWPVNGHPKFRLFSHLLGNRLMLPLYYRSNLFARYVLPLGLSNPWDLSDTIHSHYIQPLKPKESRYATWMFPRALVHSEDMLSYIWKHRNNISGIPKLLVWGMKDRMFDRTQLATWRNTFPETTLLRIQNAGHYVPEEIESGEIESIAQFLKS